MAESHNWSRDLRFITERVNGVPDPILRLELLVDVREAMRLILTENLEKAAFDARARDRDDEALIFLTRTALLDYSRRWNGRLRGTERIRWADPLNIERRKQVEDLTEVTKGNTPESVRTGFRQIDPQPPNEA